MHTDNAVQNDLCGLMRARFPFVYIPTWEEERAVEMIVSLAKDAASIKTVRKLFIWTQTDGFITEEGKEVKVTTDPLLAIAYIRTVLENAIFIMKDFHVYFGAHNRSPEYEVIRKLRDIIPELKNGQWKKNVIFLSPQLVIPDDMQKDISVLEFPLPTVGELEDKLDEMLSANERVENCLTGEDKEKLSKAALGLTLQEAENAFARAMVENGRMSVDDIAVILEEKNQVIKKTGILEFVKSESKLEDIGGLENLIRWLQKRNNTWLDAAKRYNVPSPKGVLITGVPGCGKSLTAKAMSSLWRLPLLKLDIGRIFSGIVGSSEANMRRALRTAEAVAPSILWVDEIEKGFSGIEFAGDSGIGSRVFGTFLTWMQDKTAPVFVIATANNISLLPPELLRKGRFDEIFFVDIPTYRERRDIFRVHLLKRLAGTDIAGALMENEAVPDAVLDRLAGATEGFIGAEIEQVVISALYEAFFQDRELRLHDLETVIKNTVPLSVTQAEQIMSLREWANVRAVAASSKSSRAEYAAQNKDGDDVGQSRGGRIIYF